MRSIFPFVFVLVVIATPVVASAQTSGFAEVQSQLDFEAKRHEPMLDGGVTREIGDSFAVNTFFLLSNGWGEYLAGPEYRPTESLKFGAWGGLAHGPNAGRMIPRYGLSGSGQLDELFVSGFLEFDNDVVTGTDDVGMWYDVVATYTIFDGFAAGLHLRRPDGVGPRVQWTIGSMQAWASWTPYLLEESQWRSKHGLAGILFFL